MSLAKNTLNIKYCIVYSWLNQTAIQNRFRRIWKVWRYCWIVALQGWRLWCHELYSHVSWLILKTKLLSPFYWHFWISAMFPNITTAILIIYFPMMLQNSRTIKKCIIMWNLMQISIVFSKILNLTHL